MLTLNFTLDLSRPHSIQPRDKIYSLLGLLHLNRDDGKNDLSSVAPYGRGLATRELIVDYEVSVEDIYASLVKSVVLGTQSLNILCACQRPGQFERFWVPDWREPWSRFSLLTNSIGLVPDELRKKKFIASAGQKPVIEFAQTLRSITVGGTLHSTVSELGIRPPGCEDSQWIEDWFDKVDRKLKIEISSIYEEDLESVWTPFVLSVCATNTEEDAFNDWEALAEEYCLPFTRASSEWKELVRIYRKGALNEETAENFIVDIRIAQMLDGREVFIGENGLCGLVPDHAERRDLICVLFGCDVPVVLRREADHFTFIGECYVRGLMYGEAIGALERGDVISKQFEIF